jgi:DNA repair protein RecO (recombination protein O)
VTTDARRVEAEAAYVLHAYPYKETSLLVEAFTPRHGRVALVAKGAKRPRSELRGLLQAFQPLTLAWSGRGEVKSLAAAEWRGGLPLLGGPALLCGFYLNELLLKLLPRDDPHEALFAGYEAALAGLARGDEQQALLRAFELRLLAELGYGLQLTHEAQSGEPIAAEASYAYQVERGPVRRAPDDGGGPGTTVRGTTLLALASGRFGDARSVAEAKRLMREVLDHHLEQRSLFSRRLVRDLQALEVMNVEQS